MSEIAYGFRDFLQEGLQHNPLKCEYYLPSVVSRLLDSNKAEVKVLLTTEKWYGVTYREDKPMVMAAVKKLEENDFYPKQLCGKLEAAANFCFEGVYKEEIPWGNGHINDTYRVTFENEQGVKKYYILQQMNKSIFKNPVELMENIVGVTEFLKRKISANGGNPERETLNVIPAKDGKPYYVDSEGEYWRAYVFIENTVSYDFPTSQQILKAVHNFFPVQYKLNFLPDQIHSAAHILFHCLFECLKSFSGIMKSRNCLMKCFRRIIR